MMEMDWNGIWLLRNVLRHALLKLQFERRIVSFYFLEHEHLENVHMLMNLFVGGSSSFFTVCRHIVWETF